MKKDPLTYEKKTRIMLVESSDYFRNTFGDNIRDVEIVGNVKSGVEVMSQYRNVDPDIIFMDMILCDMTGLEAARWIREQTKKIRIVLFSYELRLEFLVAGIDLGINGYLRKNASREVIENAIRVLNQGHAFVQECVDFTTDSLTTKRLIYYN